MARITTRTVLRLTRKVQLRAIAASFAAVAGTTAPATAAPRTAAGSNQAFATTTWASAFAAPHGPSAHMREIGAPWRVQHAP